MEDGVYKSYYDSGILKMETTYKDDKIIHIKEYSADGSLIIDRSGNEFYTIYALLTMATACEAYAGSHNGKYPPKLTDLTNAVPPYLGKKSNYCGTIYSGYRFTCRISEDEYLFSADPVEPDISEEKRYESIPGGIYVSTPDWEKFNWHPGNDIGTGPILREYSSGDDLNSSTYYEGIGKGKLTGTIVKYYNNKTVKKEETYINGKLVE